ncbi:hypothetical protein [Synechococcus phage BUCT-ZZ01]|nr:hypothetical protein [Synechococcus phage BUCT-ZZ01]
MSRYAQIKDGEIVGTYYDVPQSLGNDVSGFDKMTDEERESFGFFIVEQPESLSHFDPEKHDIILDEVIIVNDKCVRSIQFKQKYSDDEYFEYKKDIFWKTVRNYRDEYLRQTDWTMSPDLVDVYGLEWVNKYKNYRNYLRNISSTIDAVKNNYDFSLNLIKKPEEV